MSTSVVKMLVAVGIIILLYGIMQYVRTRHYITIGVGLAKAAVAYEQHPTNPTAHILVIGDSTAVGVGASTPADSTAGLIGRDYPTMDMINRGVSGAKVTELVNRFSDFTDQQFDLVVVQIGGNDIVRFTDYDAIKRDLPLVLAEAQRVGKQVMILHGGNIGTTLLFPAGTRWLWTKRTAAVRNIYLQIVPQYQATYIDIWRVGAADPFATDPPTYYAADYFHPSSAGYADWYTFMQPVVEDML